MAAGSWPRHCCPSGGLVTLDDATQSSCSEKGTSYRERLLSRPQPSLLLHPFSWGPQGPLPSPSSSPGSLSSVATALGSQLPSLCSSGEKHGAPELRGDSRAQRSTERVSAEGASEREQILPPGAQQGSRCVHAHLNLVPKERLVKGVRKSLEMSCRHSENDPESGRVGQGERQRRWRGLESCLSQD